MDIWENDLWMPPGEEPVEEHNDVKYDPMGFVRGAIFGFFFGLFAILVAGDGVSLGLSIAVVIMSTVTYAAALGFFLSQIM